MAAVLVSTFSRCKKRRNTSRIFFSRNFGSFFAADFLFNFDRVLSSELVMFLLVHLLMVAAVK